MLTPWISKFRLLCPGSFSLFLYPFFFEFLVIQIWNPFPKQGKTKPAEETLVRSQGGEPAMEEIQ